MRKVPLYVWALLVWDAGFFLFETYLAIFQHNGFALFFMFVFAGLFLWAVNAAKKFMALPDRTRH
jgi:hypothetical protein